VTRPILFVSDFGLDDEYVGVCHAVIARVAPGVRVIDLRHGTPARDVTAGAMTLAVAVPYAPDDAVFLAVVDPGVGTTRRGVAVEAGGCFLVGPDNGVLAPAVAALGGPSRAVELELGRVVTWPVSDTFHGRDVFAPAAAMLAAGASLEDFGTAVDPSSLERVAIEPVAVEPGRLDAPVLGIDMFGNVRLSARTADLVAADLEGVGLRVRTPAGEWPARRVRTFGDLGEEELGLLVDSAGWLAVVRNGSRAANLLDVSPYDRVILSAEGRAIG
jgi:S-adenosyl-L-methionine hydrolase (adenosine-forming)